jgi:hypothetical protein
VRPERGIWRDTTAPDPTHHRYHRIHLHHLHPIQLIKSKVQRTIKTTLHSVSVWVFTVWAYASGEVFNNASASFHSSNTYSTAFFSLHSFLGGEGDILDRIGTCWVSAAFNCSRFRLASRSSTVAVGIPSPASSLSANAWDTQSCRSSSQNKSYLSRITSFHFLNPKAVNTQIFINLE